MLGSSLSSFWMPKRISFTFIVDFQSSSSFKIDRHTVPDQKKKEQRGSVNIEPEALLIESACVQAHSVRWGAVIIIIFFFKLRV